jgi:hypothetical protein
MSSGNQSVVPFERERAREYQLTADVGEPQSFHGQTRVRIDGAGRLSAEHLALGPSGKEVTSGELGGTVAEELALDLMERAAAFPWDQSFPRRPGIPDEAIVYWGFGAADGPRATMRAWLGDVEEDPRMAPVLETLRRELATLSKGRLFL